MNIYGPSYWYILCVLVLRYIHILAKSAFVEASRAQSRHYDVSLSIFKRDLHDIRNTLILRDSQAPVKTSVLYIVGMSELSHIIVQLPIILGALAEGRPVIVLLGNSGQFLTKRVYELIGVSDFFFFEQAPHLKDYKVCSKDPIDDKAYKGVDIARYYMSSMMRARRLSSFDPSLMETTRGKSSLMAARLLVERANLLCDEVGFAQLVVTDVGYYPQGPFAEACKNNGWDVVSYNSGHRDNTLIFKRYRARGQWEHPLSLSLDGYSKLMRRWSKAFAEEAESEYRRSYNDGQWYSECGTQHNVSNHSQRPEINRMIKDGRRVCILFPHIYWDATFFWGSSLFSDYKSWLFETLVAAKANKDVLWVVKVHPANRVKNSRDNVKICLELDTIREAGIDPESENFLIIGEESDISTLSLLEHADSVLTVRGTVGWEAPFLNVAAYAAGTGRYDGLGFLRIPESREAWVNLIGQMHSQPPCTPAEQLAATIYARSLLIDRCYTPELIEFGYSRDNNARMWARIHVEKLKGNDFPDHLIKNYLSSELPEFFVAKKCES